MVFEETDPPPDPRSEKPLDFQESRTDTRRLANAGKMSLKWEDLVQEWQQLMHFAPKFDLVYIT